MSELNEKRNLLLDGFYYDETPYSESDSITTQKGWRFRREAHWEFYISLSLFGCSTNWCMGSVIASGWEFFFDIGPYRIEYLNRFIICPPKESK